MKGVPLARNHFTFEKRRKELEKKKKKEAKRLARQEKKALAAEAEAAGETVEKGPPIFDPDAPDAPDAVDENAVPQAADDPQPEDDSSS